MDASALVAALQSQGQTIAVAESCTGGLLGAAITGIPGSSAIFKGGVIAYSDDVKETVLGVKPAKLAALGSVSGGVAEAMAHGARDLFGTDMAIAISGIAGPTGGRPGKDVGTVWIAVLGPGHLLDVQRIHIDGDRDAVREGAVADALSMAQDALKEAEPRA